VIKRSTKDRVEGKFHEVKGKLVEKAGRMAEDPVLEARGQDEKNAGTAQKVIGKIEDVFNG